MRSPFLPHWHFNKLCISPSLLGHTFRPGQLRDTKEFISSWALSNWLFGITFLALLCSQSDSESDWTVGVLGRAGKSDKHGSPTSFNVFSRITLCNSTFSLSLKTIGVILFLKSSRPDGYFSFSTCFENYRLDKTIVVFYSPIHLQYNYSISI